MMRQTKKCFYKNVIKVFLTEILNLRGNIDDGVLRTCMKCQLISGKTNKNMVLESDELGNSKIERCIL